MTKPASRWLVTGGGGMLGREMDVSAWILNLAILALVLFSALTDSFIFVSII